MTFTRDICIVGAGPAGTVAALKLEQLGYPTLLIDKTSFPREKVCGDAIGVKAIWGLNQIDKEIIETFRKRSDIKLNCWGIRIGFSNGKTLLGTFPTPLSQIDTQKDRATAFISLRKDFDNYLVDWAKSKPAITLWENTAVANFKKIPEGYILCDNKGKELVRSKLLLIAEGALSHFTRNHLNKQLPDNQYFSSIRSYFSNVKGFDEYNILEMHFLKDITPGYFWLFPGKNGLTNAGLGIRKNLLKKSNIDLKKKFYEIIHKHPFFVNRFTDSTEEFPARGGVLPISYAPHSISGNHYLLLGDAAVLADPFTGEGISNAILSGVFAGEIAARSVENNNPSGSFLKAYDDKVFNMLSSEYSSSNKLHRIMKHTFITNTLLKILSEQKLNDLITAMYNDVEYRNQVLKPQRIIGKLLKNPMENSSF